MKTKNIIAVIVFVILMAALYQLRVMRENELVKTYGGTPMPDISEGAVERIERKTANEARRVERERLTRMQEHSNQIAIIDANLRFQKAMGITNYVKDWPIKSPQ